MHGRSEARLAVSFAADSVLVEVADDNSRHPMAVDNDDAALDGRGLTILNMLATHWGVRDEALGKTVWFRVSAPWPIA